MTHSPQKTPKLLITLTLSSSLAIAASAMAATRTHSGPPLTPNSTSLKPETKAETPSKSLPPPTDKTNHPPPNKRIPPLTQSDPRQLLTITQCNGIDGHAHFRSLPQFSDAAIIGIVTRGDPVYLTGQVRGTWLEAIAPLVHVTDQATVTNQWGWIADCWQ